MGQKTHQFFCPVGRHPADLRAAQSQLLKRTFHCVGTKLGEFVLHRFLGRQREELAFFNDTRYLHIRIDHCLRQ